MAGKPDVRIGNAERDRAADSLGEHFRAGRLDVGEFDERITAAYGAKTMRDLDRLFADLPGATNRPARPQPSRHRRSFAMFLLRAVAYAIVGVLAIAVAVFMFPLLILGFVLWNVVGRGGCGPQRHRYNGYMRHRAGAWS